jgi:hypothetical protein
VFATGRGPRYSVNDADGKLLSANILLAELRDKHPKAYRQVNSAIVLYAGIGRN